MPLSVATRRGARLLVLPFLFASLWPCINAQATSLIVDANGILKGATGVPVNGRLYDVEFVEGTCTQVFGVCDEAHFAFTTEGEALAASKALLDFVFLDVPGLGDFDSNPALTNGCSYPPNCWALTPYRIMGSGFLITQTLNSDASGADSYSVYQPFGPGLSITGYDSSADSNGVFAKWTRVPDSGPGPPCTYVLKAGSAATLIRFCVSENGTVVELEAPGGAEHINVGQVWEGYAVCTGTTVQAWDLSATSDGFGPPTVLKGPSATSVTLRRTSEQYQLDQTFALDKKEKDLTIAMTLTNIGGAAVPDVRIARAYDPDVDNDFGDDVEVKSVRGVWASDMNAVTLTGTTWNIPTDTAIDTGSAAACSPAGAASPATTSDGSLANVTYRVGNMPPGAKKTIRFVYRVQ